MNKVTLGTTGITSPQNAFGALPVQRDDFETAIKILRRAPSAGWLSEHWQNEFKKIPNCTGCGACMKKCPYSLDIPMLLKKNYEDYQNILNGITNV